MTGSHIHQPMIDATVNYRFSYIRLVCKSCGASWRLKPLYAALVAGCRFLCYLLSALAALWIWDQDRISLAGKIAMVFGLCALSLLGDWSVYGVLLPLLFLEFRDRENEKWRFYLIACSCFAGTALLISGPIQIFQLGALPAPLLLKRYNGERGSGAAFHKWFFYVFYPAHLLLLWWLTTVI